uniref:Uncharacterized protein n=1 Tax=Romanomermis culicivorax TaxID=13658 RepID=A0A915L0K0_ROMCU
MGVEQAQKDLHGNGAPQKHGNDSEKSLLLFIILEFIPTPRLIVLIIVRLGIGDKLFGGLTVWLVSMTLPTAILDRAFNR